MKFYQKRLRRNKIKEEKGKKKRRGEGWTTREKNV